MHRECPIVHEDWDETRVKRPLEIRGARIGYKRNQHCKGRGTGKIRHGTLNHELSLFRALGMKMERIGTCVWILRAQIAESVTYKSAVLSFSCRNKQRI